MARRVPQAALLLGALALAAGVVAWLLPSAERPSADPRGPADPLGAHDDAPGLAAHPDNVPRAQERPPPPAATGESPAAAPAGMLTALVPVYDEQGRLWGGGVHVTAVVAAAAGEADGMSTEAVTDDTGHARFTVPADRAVRFVIRRGGGEAAKFDWPARADSKSTAPVLSLRRRESLVLRVRRRGVPTLPSPFDLTVDGQPVEVRETQPAEGFVIGTFELSDQPQPRTLAFTEVGGPTISVPLPPDDCCQSPTEATIDLAPAGPPLRIEILPAAGMDVTLLILQRRDEATGAWEFDRALRVGGGPDADGTVRTSVAGLPAGRYRVLETTSMRTSGEATILTGAAPAILKVDLDGAGIARGHVEFPEGSESTFAEIWLFDPATTTGDPRARSGTGPDGTFSVVVPGDRDVRIEARHPRSLPGAPGSSVTVREPRADIVLRLVPAPAASIRLLGPDGKPVVEYVSVTLRRRDPGAVPSRAEASIRDGEVRFSGFAPGRYDVFLDCAPSAPLLLQDVDLAATGTYLGTHALTAGRSIRLRALKPDDMAWPRGLSAFVESFDPTWHPIRTGGVSAAGEGRVSGLLPGRYRVRFLGNGGLLPAAVGVEQTVEVTEADEPLVTIDFRPAARETR